MTLDERIQALTMHLEVLSGMHQDMEKSIQERLAAQQAAMEEQRRSAEQFKERMTAYAADVKDSIKRLTRIMEIHDIRLDDHEERLDKLEGGR